MDDQFTFLTLEDNKEETVGTPPPLKFYSPNCKSPLNTPEVWKPDVYPDTPIRNHKTTNAQL